MPRKRCWIGWIAGAMALAIGPATTAQVQIEPVDSPQPADAPPTTTASHPATPPAAAPAPSRDGRQPIKARVIEVTGDAKVAPLDSSDWQPVKLGDEYGEGTKIITGVRSAVKLQIGDEAPYSCLLIDSVGLTTLSEAAIIRNTTKKVRIGVGYGRVRAGVAEGGLESDFTVDSPVATLSKRGTWNFSLYYERDTDIFEISLLDRGLVMALNRATGQRRSVRPRELVTQVMRNWLDQSQIERNVPVPDILGQGDIQIAFNRISDEGLGVLAPGDGRRVMLELANPRARALFARRARQALLASGLPPLNFNQRPLRPEGFFGTGRGDELIDVVIKAGDQMALKGFARPGAYHIRRSALEGWLQRNGR